MKSGIPWNEAAKHLYGWTGIFRKWISYESCASRLAIHDNVQKLRQVAYRSAEIIHTHEPGREGAAIQAYAVALVLQTETGNLEPKEFLIEIGHFTENKIYKEKIEKTKALLPVEDKSVRAEHSVQLFEHRILFIKT